VLPAGFAYGGVVLASIAGGFGSRNTFSAKGFALLAAPELAGFFVALFQLQTLEKTIILDLFLQYAHGLLDVVVDDPDFNVFQISRPLLHYKVDRPQTCGGYYFEIVSKLFL
jgi:hypothetical protein